VVTVLTGSPFTIIKIRTVNGSDLAPSQIGVYVCDAKRLHKNFMNRSPLTATHAVNGMYYVRDGVVGSLRLSIKRSPR